MYQLITKKGKVYWLSQTESHNIREMLSKQMEFITLSRYDKTINRYEIVELGVPDFALPMIQKGYEILFDGDIPVVIGNDFESRYEDGKWNRYEGKPKKEFKNFSIYLGEIKRLN